MFISEKDQYLPTDLLSNYREYLKSQNYSTPTVKNYLTDLRHLILWLKQTNPQFEFSQINEASLRSYYTHLNERFATTPSIVARRLSSLRKFLTWAAAKDFVSADLVRATSSLLAPSQKVQFPPTPI